MFGLLGMYIFLLNLWGGYDEIFFYWYVCMKLCKFDLLVYETFFAN